MTSQPNLPTAPTALIIDDEVDARAVIRTYLRTYCPSVVLLGEAKNVAQAFRLIRQLKPSLIFLDIQLTDGVGFDLLDQFPNPGFQIIFITAHDEFALKAFQYSAADYLLKPIDPDEFANAVDKCIRQVARPDLGYLSQLLQPPRDHAAFEKIALSTQEGLTLLRLDDIVRLESDKGYTTFHAIGGERVLVSRVIREFEDLLPGAKFFRVHVSHLIHLDFVKKVNWEDGGQVVMENGDLVPLARRRKVEFMEALKGRVQF